MWSQRGQTARGKMEHVADLDKCCVLNVEAVSPLQGHRSQYAGGRWLRAFQPLMTRRRILDAQARRAVKNITTQYLERLYHALDLPRPRPLLDGNLVEALVTHAVPHLKAAGGGSIINLSSIYGLVGAADLPAYHASKGAVRLMSKTDAMTYAPDKIRVNSIHPGFIWTPMVENFLADQGDITTGREATDALHPLGHVGEPDDVAWGAVYLASDEAKFVTGSELVIDGGYTAR